MYDVLSGPIMGLPGSPVCNPDQTLGPLLALQRLCEPVVGPKISGGFQIFSKIFQPSVALFRTKICPNCIVGVKPGPDGHQGVRTNFPRKQVILDQTSPPIIGGPPQVQRRELRIKAGLDRRSTGKLSPTNHDNQSDDGRVSRLLFEPKPLAQVRA